MRLSNVRTTTATALIASSMAMSLACGNRTPSSNLESRQWAEFNQIDRIRYIETKKTSPGTAHGKVEYTENRQRSDLLDILVVMDNSGSMSPYQANLATKLDPLLSFVQNADWRIHVVTTDTDEVGGSYLRCPDRGLINKADADARQKFARAVSAGTNGDSTERGIKAARLALEAPCANSANWMRPGAALAILFVTDEDNCSGRGGCASEGGGWDEASYLGNYLASTRRLGDNVRVFGILEDSAGTPNACQAAPTANGTRYWEVIHSSGGICGAVRDADYTATLKAISANTAALVTPVLTLGSTPIAGTVVVTLDGQPMAPADYNLVGQEVRLTRNIQLGQKVTVEFDYASSLTPGNITLLHPAYPDTIRVFAQDHFVPASDFTFDATTRALTVVPSLAGEEISVIYRENQPLRTVFPFGRISNPATLRCFLDDMSLMSGVQYVAADETIVLTNPPRDGELFRCTTQD